MRDLAGQISKLYLDIEAILGRQQALRAEIHRLEQEVSRGLGLMKAMRAETVVQILEYRIVEVTAAKQAHEAKVARDALTVLALTKERMEAEKDYLVQKENFRGRIYPFPPDPRKPD